MAAASENGDKAYSADVDAQLIEQQIQDLFRFKILLLGAGESGKSTIVKQLKYIHRRKLEDEELKLTADSLHQNVVDCTKAVLTAAQHFNVDFGPKYTPMVEHVLAIANGNNSHGIRLNVADGNTILELFKSEPFQQVFARRSEFWVLDSYEYYIDNLHRFTEEDYKPSEEDCIMARIRTTGIVVTELEQRIIQEREYEPDKLLYQVVDVGGQRNERKKWIHCFDDVRAILFIENLAGYNQVLFEDNTKNRMRESLELFTKITSTKQFADTPIFLFLNKKDLFSKMIAKVDLAVEFPDYTGGCDSLAALDFIKAEFQKCCPDGKKVLIDVVAACVRAEIRSAFQQVKITLYDTNRDALLEQVAKLTKQKGKAQKVAAGQSGRGGCCGKTPVS